MRLNVRTNGDLEIRQGAKIALPLLFVALGVLALPVGVDVFTFECDRASDACSYRSAGLLQGIDDGELRLSSIDYLDDAPDQYRGSSSNELYTTVLHTAQLTDGTSIEMEGRRRTVLIDDGLTERFNAFRRSQSPRLEVSEVHFGMAGVVVLGLFVIGFPLLVLARGVRFEALRGARRYALRRRGVVGGWHSEEGPLADLVAVELNTEGSYKGAYLARRDGHRLALSFGDAGPEVRAAAEQLAAQLGLPLLPIEDSAVKRHARGVSPLPAVGCMLLALAPLAIPVLWCLVSGLLTIAAGG